MPVRTIDCPSCGERQPADDSASASGRRIKCRKCQVPFSANDTHSQRESPTAAPPVHVEESTAVVEPVIGRVGRFELRAALGQGAFGRVYRAYDPLLDRQVAIKMPRSPLDQPRRIARFLREAKAAARLRHPNIVAVFESGKSGEEYYIVSEFVQGVPLSVKMAESRPNLVELIRWVQQIAEGLAYAHSEGVIHRDIKPANIMLGISGRPQIMDFGMAKRLDEDATMTTEGSLLGTPAYMSPEQARSDSKSVGASSDQYSLGVILYELLTAQKPFDGPPHVVIGKVASVDPPAPRTVNPAIPKDLDAICQKAMAKEPARRYASVADMALDLERWLNGEQVKARPALSRERVWRWCQRHPALAVMTVFASLSLTLAASVSVAYAIHQNRVANELSRAVENATAQKELAVKASQEARVQSERANSALTEAQTQRDKTAIALAESEKQRERAERALRDAETQRTRAENALADSQASKAEAESERAQVRRLRTELFLDRGLRLCDHGDVVQGMLWLAEALQIASESGDLAEYARVARENLSAWRPHVARAKKQRTGDVVLDASIDGELVHRGPVRSGDARPPSIRWDLVFEYVEPVCVVFSADHRVALVFERGGKSLQVYSLGAGLPTPTAPFEKAKVLRNPGRAVAFLSANGRRGLFHEDTGLATLWEIRAKEPLEKPVISLANRRILALALSADGKLAACIAARPTGPSTVRLYDVDAGKLRAERDLRSSNHAVLAFGQQGRWLLASDQLFDTESLEPLAGPLPYSEAMGFAAFSPAGSPLATCSARSIWLWDAAGKLIREIPCNRDIDELVFDSTGQYALTRDRSHVQLWDIRTGRAVGPAWEPQSGMAPFLGAALPPAGDSVVIAASTKVYRVPRPQTELEGSAEKLRVWVQVLTEAELASDGSVRLLDAAAWKSRLERLKQHRNQAGL